MSNPINPQNGTLLSDAVQTAGEVTDGTIEDSVIGVLQAEQAECLGA